MSTSIRPEVEEWCQALESGQHQQGFGRLTTLRGATALHCCLGVLCHLWAERGELNRSNHPPFDGRVAIAYGRAGHHYATDVLPDDAVAQVLNIRPGGDFYLDRLPTHLREAVEDTLDLDCTADDLEITLVEVNDSRAWGFPSIAALIRAIEVHGAWVPRVP